MARVSVGGNEEANVERSNNQRLPKKPRTSSAVPEAHKKPSAAANASTSAAAQTPTARVLPPLNPVASAKEPESGSAEESFTLMDPSVFDCPICFEPLSSPVYQCHNGHIACQSCCTEMSKKCPSCNWPILIRCRALEMVIESVQTKCRNVMYGCMEKRLICSKRFDHERTCIYAPCSCPEIDCDYVGMSKCLYRHFASQHKYSSKVPFNCTILIMSYPEHKHAFVIEEKDNVLFILNRSIESVGSFFHVVCVAPATTKREYLYELTASDAEKNSSVKLETHLECVPKWRPEDPAKVRLLVPPDFESPGGKLMLDLTIRRNDALGSR